MQSRPIRFFHRGAVVEIAGAAPTRTVLEWLREDAHCNGTKEGCNEGDCGACTVVIGEAATDGSTLRLRSVNACIQFLPMLDGKALFTVEDLTSIQREASTGDDLHPVQRALVDQHASQCGFCTPGFAMSLFTTYERHQASGTRPSRQQLADDLSGNLCRCTGYRPIIDAGQRMFDAPAVQLDTSAAIEALKALAADDALVYRHGDATLQAPRTLDAFAGARLAAPEARLLAGATDIGLWVTKQFRALPSLLAIGAVDELKRITVVDDTLRIGAGASLEAAYRELVQRWPTLEDVWLRFASPPIRHAGTIGGNVANGSPIGDSAPVLMALDATLVLRRGGVQRRVPLASFYVGYMQNVLVAGEFIEAIEVPLGNEAHVRAYKISKRFDSDISAVCAGLCLRLREGVVVDARFAFGGMAATVMRAARAEAAVTQQPWTEATLATSQAALGADFEPLDDMRASAAYRRQVAANLLRRLWLETRADAPLPSAAVSVWCVMPHAASPLALDAEP